MPSELPSEGRFLVGEDLSNAIRRVVQGDNVRCAVAYWGDHGFRRRAVLDQEWKIVCDIHSGNTSPNALRSLGAPRNRNLRFFRNLHAKVYMSDCGVIICSANASAGGLYYDGRPARLQEAGVFHPPGSGVFESCLNWFDSLFTNSDQVDRAALIATERRFLPERRLPEDLNKNSLLRSALTNREQFLASGVSFVFVENPVDQSKLRKAIEDNRDNDAITLLGGADNVIRDLDLGKCYQGWDPEEIRNIGKMTVEFYKPYQPKPRLRMREVILPLPDGGFALARQKKAPTGLLLNLSIRGEKQLTLEMSDGFG